LAVATLVLAGLCGCGPSAPAVYKVTGNVTWNGKPLPDGQIVFTPEDAKVAPDAGKITNGAFEVMVKPAPSASRSMPAARVEGRSSDGRRPARGIHPERYNAKTTLKAEVTPGGENRFTYDLTEKAVNGPEPAHPAQGKAPLVVGRISNPSYDSVISAQLEHKSRDNGDDGSCPGRVARAPLEYGFDGFQSHQAGRGCR